MSTRTEHSTPDELAFALRLRTKLNASAATLDKSTSERLFAARQCALARHPESRSTRTLLATGRSLVRGVADALRPLSLALLLVAALIGADYMNSRQRVADLEAVDSALLADDLPIRAYLDRGFEAWLNNSAER